MKFEGDAVQYTAFAIVAIESIWPNPDGNELSPDSADMDLLTAEPQPLASEVRSSFGTTLESSQGVVTERDYHGKQGYYKILPLNLTSVKTSTDLEGSNFTATFTLDDLLLVTSEENAMRYATGLPFSANDLVESDQAGALPVLTDNEEEWRYVRDEELGLSRYRLSGPNSGFNVEDLIGINDTVTIWIYHDPADFYIKDGNPYDLEYFDDGSNLMRFNDKITSVIGSGDRRNQFSTSQISFDEQVLGELGIINEFTSSALHSLVTSGADASEITAQVPKISHENVADIVMQLATMIQSGTAADLLESKVNRYLSRVFGSDISYQSVNSIAYSLSKFVYLGQPVATSEGVINETDHAEKLFRSEAQLLRDLLGKLPYYETDSGYSLFVEDVTQYSNDDLIRIGNTPGLVGLGDINDLERFITGVNLLVRELNKKAENYVARYLRRQKTTWSRQAFINGRSVLMSPSHGETPYLALKGVVSRIESSIGTNEGSYTVTVSGTGYEKVLKTNEVYYEDMVYRGGFATTLEHQTFYVHMQPPRAIQHLISRWAAKQIVLDFPNDYSTGALYNHTFLMAPLTVAEDAENELDKTRENVANNKVPVRGHYVATRIPDVDEGYTADDVRYFSPVNYLDTTRIQEMTRTINRSFRDPDIESTSNVPVTLDDKRSIWDNAKKLGGLENFYQLFVDETGRVRYRLAFEAMERTPRPAYTPTIQDYDVLADGNSFVTDDSQVVTLVNVMPVTGAGVGYMVDLGLAGRSAPEPGRVPIGYLEENFAASNLAPEFFRYGMRSMRVDDMYSAAQLQAADKKAHAYRDFFGQPLKKAILRVRNNTSYRVGETVLVSLQNNKRRSRALIELRNLYNWIDRLIEDEKIGSYDTADLRRIYFGVDERVLERGKKSLHLTSGEYNIFWDSGLSTSFYQELMEDPHLFVAKKFRDTIEFMMGNLPGVNVITPEYFPTTYWYFKDKPGGAYGWDENRVKDENIIDAYGYALKAMVLQNMSSSAALRYLMHRSVPETTGLINNVKFQDFRATSYFIESVSHNFIHGADASTTLGLNYGQDNLVLLDPINHLPFGFMSIERKFRIGYDSPHDHRYWNSFDSEPSSLMNMYVEQYLEDELYKNASFLYNAQFLRNSSNYMYEIATVREGLDTYVEHGITEDPENVVQEVTTKEPPQTTDREDRAVEGVRRSAEMYRIISNIKERDPNLVARWTDDELTELIHNYAVLSQAPIDVGSVSNALRTKSRVARPSNVGVNELLQ